MLFPIRPKKGLLKPLTATIAPAHCSRSPNMHSCNQHHTQTLRFCAHSILPSAPSPPLTLTTWYTPALLAVSSSVLILKLVHPALLTCPPSKTPLPWYPPPSPQTMTAWYTPALLAIYKSVLILKLLHTAPLTRRPYPHPMSPAATCFQTLTTWYTPALLAVYSSVLILKLVHAALLLWAPEKATSWRETILWTERVVRTLVSVRVVAYGKQYKAWMDRTSTLYTARVLL